MLCRKRTRSLAIAGCLSLALCQHAVGGPAERATVSRHDQRLRLGRQHRSLPADWAKTQIGQLMADPIMQPFVEDFQRNCKASGTRRIKKLGITWDDLSGVPTGEVAIAMIQPSKTEAAFVLIADVTGHKERDEALLEKIHKNLTTLRSSQAQHSRSRTAARSRSTTFPSTTTMRPGRRCTACRQEVLIATDNLQVLRVFWAASAGRGNDIAGRAAGL